MSDQTYNVDDILEEVKKRREEQEAQIKSKAQPVTEEASAVKKAEAVKEANVSKEAEAVKEASVPKEAEAVKEAEAPVKKAGISEKATSKEAKAGAEKAKAVKKASAPKEAGTASAKKGVESDAGESLTIKPKFQEEATPEMINTIRLNIKNIMEQAGFENAPELSNEMINTIRLNVQEAMGADGDKDASNISPELTNTLKLSIDELIEKSGVKSPEVTPDLVNTIAISVANAEENGVEDINSGENEAGAPFTIKEAGEADTNATEADGEGFKIAGNTEATDGEGLSMAEDDDIFANATGAMSEIDLESDEVDELFADKDGEVDLLSLSDKLTEDEYAEVEAKEDEKRKKKKKIIKIVCIVLAVIVVLLAAAGVYAYYYINSALDQVVDEETTEEVASLELWDGMDELVENFETIYEDGYVYSYKAMLKNWYYNGTPVSSTHVYNVLLIGEDTRDEEVEDEDTRADSAIIASINIDTGEIILTSILRDSYCYYEVTEGDESTGTYGKINGAMVEGIDCYIRAVENNFKLNIDNYVIVNFDSFETIIDALGGVDIDMTQEEIDEINNHPSRYGDVYIDATEGTVHLDGEQALAYCRIRKIDSDNVRADRQKTVLVEIFNMVQETSSLQTVSIVGDLLPYVKTGITKSEILAIAKYALANNWLTYDISTYTVPNGEDVDDDGNLLNACVGGTYYGAWIYKLDYPVYAKLTQERIYGKTNIVLADNRPDFSTLN